MVALLWSHLAGAAPPPADSTQFELDLSPPPPAAPEDELAPLVPVARPAEAPPPLDPPQVVEAPPPPPAKAAVGLELGLKLALVIPVGKAGPTIAAADAAAQTTRSVAPAVALAVRYRLPFARSLVVAAEGGYSRLSGSGSRQFVNDPDYGPSLEWSWKMDQIPLLLGLAWELPLGIPLKLAPVAGGAAVYVSSQTRYGPAGAQLADAPQQAWALGWYAGVEASLPLGPGALAVEARYLGARTDLGFSRLYGKTVNGSPGDVQGTQVLAGYRFSF